jgi:hypothetical protein
MLPLQLEKEGKVKRKDNKDKFSTEAFLKRIQCKIFTGDAFDNMEDFFSGNGYDIVDKNIHTTKLLLITFGVFVMKICTQSYQSNE